ncbi:MAG: DUF1134 domain-containing protein, partial [Pseudomonadota bacterium]|nr:DUF1134 domain-containing protein [Pseudomonadota bacterium]
MIKYAFLKLAAAAGLAFAAPAVAQIQTIDPNKAGEYEPAAAEEQPRPSEPENQPVDGGNSKAPAPAPAVPAVPAAPVTGSAADRASQAAGGPVAKQDVFKAAEGLFGRGAEGLAEL